MLPVCVFLYQCFYRLTYFYMSTIWPGKYGPSVCPELIKVTVSRSCKYTKKKNLTLRKIMIFSCENKKIMHFNLFYSFFFKFHTYYVIFSDIFALFCAQNIKSKVLAAHKNLLLKSLSRSSKII